jgi:hypothetical protein
VRRSDDAHNRSAHPPTAADLTRRSRRSRCATSGLMHRSKQISIRLESPRLGPCFSTSMAFGNLELESHRRPAADTELIPRRVPAIRPAARCEHVLSVGRSTVARRSWHLASFMTILRFRSRYMSHAGSPLYAIAASMLNVSPRRAARGARSTEYGIVTRHAYTLRRPRGRTPRAQER